jgi:hypothetical protein
VLAEFLFDVWSNYWKTWIFYFFLLRSMNNLEAMLLLSFAWLLLKVSDRYARHRQPQKGFLYPVYKRDDSER